MALQRAAGKAVAAAVGQPRQPPPKQQPRMMSWALRMAIATVEDNRTPVVTPELKAEAEALLAEKPRPLSPDTIVGWLRTLASGLNDAPEGDAIVGRAAALMLACQDVVYDRPEDVDPIDDWAFSDDTVVLALRRFARWPATADLYAFIKEQHQRRIQMMSACYAIMTTSPLNVRAISNGTEDR
jgi:hypothetical protein